jgi:4-hydroxy-3-polyprenylbenzoate decarboxylase
MGPMDVLDHSSRAFTFGSKMGIDATRKWASEGFRRPWPTKIATTEAAARKAAQIWADISRGWRS